MREREVVLKRARDGKDRIVGFGTTSSDGVWTIRKGSSDGRFYAVAPPVEADGGDGSRIFCPRLRSETTRGS